MLLKAKRVTLACIRSYNQPVLYNVGNNNKNTWPIRVQTQGNTINKYTHYTIYQAVNLSIIVAQLNMDVSEQHICLQWPRFQLYM